MIFLDHHFSLRLWLRYFKPKPFFVSVFAVVGVFEVAFSLLGLFSAGIRNAVQDQWWIILIILAVGAVCGIISTLPKASVSRKLKNRDTVVEIKIGDAFDIDGAALVVPVNTTFDTGIDAIDSPSVSSVQNKFQKQFYDGRTDHLDLDLERALSGVTNYEELADAPGKTKKYEIGTTVSLNVKDRLFYIVAASEITRSGRAQGTFEDTKIALAQLWYYISECGEKGDVVIPVLGSGRARLSVTREQIVFEIIKSYIAASSEKTFCDKLTIALYLPDVARCEIDISELERFLDYSCNYMSPKDTSSTPVGSPSA